MVLDSLAGAEVVQLEQLPIDRCVTFFQSCRQAIAVPGIFFAHVTGFGFPKAPGPDPGFRSLAMTRWRSPRLALSQR